MSPFSTQIMNELFCMLKGSSELEEIQEFLTKYDASMFDIDQKDACGLSIFDLTILYDKIEVLEYLLKVFDVQVRHPKVLRRLLNTAIGESNLQAVELLLRLGVDITTQSLQNEHEDQERLDTPLQESIVARNVSVLRLLLANGAEVNEKNPSTGRTALHEVGEWGGIEICDILLSKGADVNVQDNHGDTPLHLLLRYISPESAELHAILDRLLDAGANLTLKDRFDQTPLHVAAHAGKFSVIEKLLHHGAELEAIDSEGNTPLLTAIAVDPSEDRLAFGDATTQDSFVRILLKNYQPNVHVRNSQGETPLVVAIENDYDVIVGLLLGHGASWDVANSQNVHVLEIAAEAHRNQCMLDLLIQHGAQRSSRGQ